MGLILQEAKVWLKRPGGKHEIVQIEIGNERMYHLYIAYGGEYLGSVLFDAEGYWIYDAEILTIAEQEQLASFIINYKERY